MNSIFVGNSSVLAIETGITQAYAQLGQRALGFFVVHVAGKSYGIRSPEATLLACSFDAVRRRIARRGKHVVQFGSEPDAAKVVDAVRAVMFEDDRQSESFFGKSAAELREYLAVNEIVWAPDGDAAFDDGGHVLQIDQGARVRVIAFRNADSREAVANSLADVWLNADEFYDLLSEWQSRFESEWRAVLKNATSR